MGDRCDTEQASLAATTNDRPAGTSIAPLRFRVGFRAGSRRASKTGVCAGVCHCRTRWRLKLQCFWLGVGGHATCSLRRVVNAMVHRVGFAASLLALFIGVACGNSEENDDTDQGSSGSGATSASGGSNSGGSNSGGSNSGGTRSGDGGEAGATETGGAGGTSGGGSGGAGACPPSMPPSRSACSVPNLRCSYGQSICTCMVSQGVPGGVTWLCDGGGSGGSGGQGGSGQGGSGQGGSGQGGSAAGGPIEGCTQNHEGDAACALAGLPPYYYICDHIPERCTHYSGGGMTTYVCCP